ncbi:MAG TPA: peptidylprolyl isomerase [Desulfobacteraceae bacterium]|nr:MAG: peptidylprolyl isomerase [Deltaproteobacteria bacterium]HDZ24044.1 peptidylprolyl isomerase [Desulfobacteraceae bacterium]
MSKAKDGDTVKVHYTGQLENGEVFDSSRQRDPLEFVIGSGNVIPGFENGIIDMEVGDSKRITISPEEGYGERREELVVKVIRNEFPEHISPAVGQQLQIKQGEGDVLNVNITALDEESVTLDANHPLAGHTLLFDVELMEIA